MRLIPVVLGYTLDTLGGQWVFWICALFVAAAFLTFITAKTQVRQLTLSYFDRRSSDKWFATS